MTSRTASIDGVVAKIGEARREIPVARAVLVAVSGIDGSGKGYVTGKIVETLRAKGLRVAEINIDGWLNLPHVRFSKENPAEHFYRHAIRFDALFAQLVVPLRQRRSRDRHGTARATHISSQCGRSR